MPVDILVVDDDAAIRDALWELLTDEGFQVRAAADGAEALALQAAVPAALIVSDVMMPVLDGVRLVERLRARGDGTPVVLASAVMMPQAGVAVTAWLMKPFDLDSLLATIEAVLSHP